MGKKLSRLLDPRTWQRRLRAYVDRRRAMRLREQVETAYRNQGPVSVANGPRTLIADGMWDNPNHFFRLHLFLQAFPDVENIRLLGVLRHRKDRARQTLEAMGFREFIFIEEHEFRTANFLQQARDLLHNVRSHADLINLALPLGLPAYTYYDTVLKYARHPQPPLNDPLWLNRLAETLRDLAIYAQVLDHNDVGQVVLSHPWKTEFATLMWAALQRKIPSYHLTGFCEGIRVRRLLEPDDYGIPVEHLPYCEYVLLPQHVRHALSREGAAYLAKREAAATTDINARYGFRPQARIDTLTEARRALGGRPGRPLVVVYAHAWFDFPHTFGMRNFTDFLDWMRFTVEHIRKLDHVDWVLKPHPMESWYGGIKLVDLLGGLPTHIWLVPSDTDSLTSMLAADAIVTVHGTVALEAVAHGVPVIASDHSYYSDWGFTHVAETREHYVQLLATVTQLSAPTPQQTEDALSCMALSLAPTPEQVGVINLRCDSSGAILYRDILAHHAEPGRAVVREKSALQSWLQHSSSCSYSASLKVQHFSQSSTPC